MIRSSHEVGAFIIVLQLYQYVALNPCKSPEPKVSTTVWSIMYIYKLDIQTADTAVR